MAKELKTKSQLEALVRHEMGDAQISHLEVGREQVYGWNVYVVADAKFAREYQGLADKIVQKLRDQFDLEE